MIEFHGVVSFHLSAAVTAPVAVRTGCYSHWQLGSRNVPPILVSQLPEAAQATAVTQHGVPRDPVIRQQEHSSLESHEALGQHVFPRQTSGCQVILQDVRLVAVVVQHAVQTLVTQVELTERGQAAEAAGAGAAPVQMAERLQADGTLLRGDTWVLLALRSPVGHGLEAAGAQGVASLQRAHVILDC